MAPREMKRLKVPPPPVWAVEATEFCIQKIRNNLAGSLDGFPERTERGRWICVDNGGWVGGHWVGMLWLAYAYTKDPVFETEARTWAERLKPRQDDPTTHDLGFLFTLSHILGYRLTGDPALRTIALHAAGALQQRFNPYGRYIQAWGPVQGSPEQRGRTIIDTMMNLDLLLWAGQETGESMFAECALAHAHTSRIYHIRPDYSTAHVADFDPDNGTFIKQDTHQGFSATSCWSRGQSWAVYGFTDSFEASGDTIFLETAANLADYALDRLPEDRVPFWDFDSPEIPKDVRDSSAGAILGSALLKIGKLADSPPIAKMRWTQGCDILMSLWDGYSSRGTHEPSILLHGTRSRPHGLQDHGLIYGDYYFLEGLMRLQEAIPEGF